MAKKSVWLSWTPGDAEEARLHEVGAALTRVGLEVRGAPWANDLARMDWMECAGQLIGDSAPDAWLIVGRAEDFADRDVRYGLSMAAAVSDSEKGAGPVIVTLDDDATALAGLSLLQGAPRLDARRPDWAAQLVAHLHRPHSAAGRSDVHFNVIAHAAIGQWYEAAPAEGAWSGALFCVADDGATVDHIAVGPRGVLPERTSLEFPQRGLKAASGGVDFTGSAVRNNISAEESFYAKVSGAPSCVLFGPYDPDADETESYILRLS
ncbi:MAG: hypothetical protein AAGC95_16660 [Pseudomonadota bacterium]